MKRKEFIKRMDKIIEGIADYDTSYTCPKIGRQIAYYAYTLYARFIACYTTMGQVNDTIHNDYLDSRNSRKTVRVLMLTSFKEECLSTGIYKEF